MNKPKPTSDATLFLIVLSIMGLIVPIMLCGAGVALFGFKTSSRVVMPLPRVAASTIYPSQTLPGEYQTLPNPYENLDSPYGDSLDRQSRDVTTTQIE